MSCSCRLKGFLAHYGEISLPLRSAYALELINELRDGVSVCLETVVRWARLNELEAFILHEHAPAALPAPALSEVE